MTRDDPRAHYTFIQRWRAFTYALGIVRIAIIVLAAGLVMLLTAQGQDIIIGLAEQGNLASQPFFLVVLYWAFSIWYWSRVLLNIRFPEPPTALYVYNYWRRTLPRLLGTGAYGAIALALLICLDSAPAGIRPTLWAQFFSSLAWGGLFLLFITRRRVLLQRLHGWMARPETGSALRMKLARAFDTRPFEIRDQEQRTAGTLWAAMREFALWFALLNIALQLLLFFGAWFWPVALGGLLGALLLLLLWGGSWLPIGSFLTYQADRHGWPLLTGLLGAALLFSLWNDNHEIRAIDARVDVSQRPDLASALLQWRAQFADDREPVPFVVVAAAGGGIRAAYWTATVLGELQDRVERFDRRLFAISGVSGGSVGAAVYRAAIDGAGAIPGCRQGPVASVRTCTQAVLEGEFLGPAVARLLYPDLLQRFLPGPLMPDRAAALEAGWEAAFQQVTGSERFGEPLTRLYREEGRQWPALLLNATWSENGRRLVASNIRLTHEDFPLALDQLTILGRGLRLSTAAHNSARFPGVSPPGSWSMDGHKRGHLVDGGYFENYGAETALALLRAAERRLGGRIRPVVILISSDPGLPEPLSQVPATRPIAFSYEIRGILTAMFKARNARGVEAATRLLEWARERHYPAAHFRMCEPAGEGQDSVEPPLGWTLSQAARRTINGYLPPQGRGAECGNAVGYQRVLRTLGPRAEAPGQSL